MSTVIEKKEKKIIKNLLIHTKTQIKIKCILLIVRNQTKKEKCQQGNYSSKTQRHSEEHESPRVTK